PADKPKVGRLDLRGLPFEIGTDESHCFVVLGRGYEAEATIPINSRTSSLVFAHRLVESPILSGGPVGAAVVELRFLFDEGPPDIVTRRYRFKTPSLPVGGGKFLFAAYPDRFD